NEITFRYVADDSQTVVVDYQAVNGTVDPEQDVIREADAAGLSESVNAEAATGYEFDAWYKGSVDEANKLGLPEDPTAEDVKAVLNTNADSGLYEATTLVANYTPKSDAGYKVHYVLDGTEDAEEPTYLSDDKVVSGVEFDKQFSEVAATIDGYRLADDETSPKTVTAGYGNNEITFRYVA
ncbi:hypothetical protein, partial [Candidatus Collinsella stercoripullorum]|uniref:hypothetical protein n=1 Tax=Candidatus Collinsella stercoripullorum TaxID=2838522 RepID=UPI0022E808CE